MKTSVLLELVLQEESSIEALVHMVSNWAVDGFELDVSYEPVPMGAESSVGGSTVILHGWVKNRAVLEVLKAQPLVFNVWEDTVVEPMSPSDT